MMRLLFSISVMALCVTSVVFGQESPAMDPEACAKHCREMAAAQEKAAAQRQAAWKEIEAQLEVAKNARGDKKVAALEAAVQKLVAYHASMAGQPGGCATMGGHEHERMAGHAMGCCRGEMKGCCGSGAAGPAGHGPHCAMMKDTAH